MASEARESLGTSLDRESSAFLNSSENLLPLALSLGLAAQLEQDSQKPNNSPTTEKPGPSVEVSPLGGGPNIGQGVSHLSDGSDSDDLAESKRRRGRQGSKSPRWKADEADVINEFPNPPTGTLGRLSVGNGGGGAGSKEDVRSPLVQTESSGKKFATLLRKRTTSGKKNLDPKSPADTERSFAWETSSVDTKGTFRKNRGCCTSCIECYGRVPLGPRCLLYILTGVPVLIAPAILDFVFNIRYDANLPRYRLVRDFRNAATPWRVGDASVFVWSVFITIQWTVHWCLRYGITVLPDILVRIVDAIWGTTSGISGEMSVLGSQAKQGGLKSKIVYGIGFLRSMRPHLLFFLYQLFLTVNFSETFAYEINPFDLGAINNTTKPLVEVEMGTAATTVPLDQAVNFMGPLGIRSEESNSANSGLDPLFNSVALNATAANAPVTIATMPWESIVLRILLCIFFLFVFFPP